MHVECTKKPSVHSKTKRLGGLPFPIRLERTLCRPIGFDSVGYWNSPFEDDKYEGVSTTLLDLARSPILRGTKKYGVAGNGHCVVGARLFLANKIVNDVPIREDWAACLGSDEEAIESFVVKAETQHWCPICKEAI